jgi:hypothetical protein
MKVNGIWKNGERQFLYSEFPCDNMDENNLSETRGVPCHPDSGPNSNFGTLTYTLAPRLRSRILA